MAILTIYYINNDSLKTLPTVCDCMHERLLRHIGKLIIHMNYVSSCRIFLFARHKTLIHVILTQGAVAVFPAMTR